mgnify:CR=1 FL=1
MVYLTKCLQDYSRSDFYPFHMPGHKRKSLALQSPYEIDITEIDSFDNLHHATGILKEAQQRGADLYGSKRCFFLVNGSTCGLLSAICAVTKRGDKVLVARNCHKAVYNALYLNGLQAEYIYPCIAQNGLQGQISAKQITQALRENPDIGAVIITSPTYEGIVSDVEGIAKICHAHGIPLIVDEAHGAHFGFGSNFPENAVRLGADIVVMSLHKTLPSFTQTALLHINSNMIDEKRVERFLGIYETSSPSYVLMAGMDECIRLVADNGQTLFSNYREHLNTFYDSINDLAFLHVMNKKDLNDKEAFDWDDSKIVIFTKNAGMTGEELHQLLLKKYHLQMEMVSGYYVLGMTSLMDDNDGFKRLSNALHEIDSKIMTKTDFRKNDVVRMTLLDTLYQKNPFEMQIYQASDLPYKAISLDKAIGNMSADTIYLYPPGIPMIIPGEIITKRLADGIKECISLGLNVEGLVDMQNGIIKIVDF